MQVYMHFKFNFQATNNWVRDEIMAALERANTTVLDIGQIFLLKFEKLKFF